MAYNPFDFFRSNQKIFFAVITVIVMFVFILQFGSGKSDFFNWFPEMLRSNRSTGDVMAVIDGSEIKESKLSDLRKNRTFANQYMILAQARATENLDSFIRESMKKTSPELQSRMGRFNTAQSTMQTQMQSFEQFLQTNRGNPQLQQFIQQQAMQLMDNVNAALQSVLAFASTPNLKPDDRDVLDALKKLTQLRRNASSDRQFFIDMPNKTARDSLEFLLWLKKADSLGIRFRAEDVDAMVSQEFLTQYFATDREKVLGEMLSEQRQKPLTRDKLYQVLADEFRVRTAMITVLGPQETRGVESMNPFDLYEFYRKETSYGRYHVIAFPVDNFLDQVKGEPSDQELKKLFDQTRKIEPNPNDPRPGIKEPRKIKVQFLEATGKEPFYTTAGADALLKTELHAKLAGLMTVPFGAGSASLFIAPSILALPEPALQASYKRYVEDQKSKLARRWFPGPFSEPYNVPLDANLINYSTIFSTIGIGATPTAVLSIPYAFFAEGDALEKKARLTYGFPLFAPPLMDGLAGLTDITAAWAVQGMGIPEPLPLAAVKPVLAKEMNELMRYGVCQTDLQNFYDEWLKLATPKSKDETEKAAKEAQEYLTKFTGTQPWKDKDGKDQMGRGLKLSAPTEFHDQYDLINDPILAPLVKVTMPTDSKSFKNPLMFSHMFFSTFDPRTRQVAAATGLFKPILDPRAREVPTPNDLSPVYIAWRTAEQAAVEPKLLDEARAKVVAVWKRQKAKELAKAAADDLAKQFDGKLGSNFIEIGQKMTSARTEFANAKFADPKLREKVAQFEIPDPEDKSIRGGVGANMVMDQPSRQPGGDSGFVLQSFGLVPTAQIPYTSQKMTDDLIANRNKPISTAFTMMDTPESTVYVAVLEDRSEESPLRFNSIVYNPDPNKPNQVSAAIFQQFRFNAVQNARQIAVEMLKAEYGYEKENPELDKKFSDSSN